VDRCPQASATDEEVGDRSILVAYLSGLNVEEADRWAHQLLDEFGSIGAIMSQSRQAQARVTGSKEAARWLHVASELTRLWLLERARKGPVFNTTPELIDYLRSQHAFATNEHLRALFLNGRNMLMRDETMWEGSLDQAPFWPREILRRALELNAASIVLVHNHPSGDHEPSQMDIKCTARLIEAAKVLEIRVSDHLIFSSSGYTSLRRSGLI
jgi:DNA repair protein RadC